VSSDKVSELDPEAIDLGGYNARGKVEPSAELVHSVRTLGVLEPVGVRREGELVRCVYGFRRVMAARIAARMVPVVWVELDAIECMVANVAENHHRSGLRVWELAEAIHRIANASLERGELDPIETTAQRLGISSAYAGNLYRLRQRLAPDVWRQVQAWGTSERVSFDLLTELATLPWDEQIERWNQAIDRAGGARRGAERAPGRAKIAKLLKRLEEHPEAVREGEGFGAGARYALRVVLGRERWRHGDVSSPRTKRRKRQERKGLNHGKED